MPFKKVISAKHIVKLKIYLMEMVGCDENFHTLVKILLEINLKVIARILIDSDDDNNLKKCWMD